jgi:hypothetical protein
VQKLPAGYLWTDVCVQVSVNSWGGCM